MFYLYGPNNLFLGIYSIDMSAFDLQEHIISDITNDIGLRYNGTDSMPDLEEIQTI